MSESDSDLSESSEAAPSPLRTACVNGSVDAVRICLDRGGDDIDEVDWIGRTPLVDAIQCGRTEVTRMLLDYGADVNWADKAGLTPLHFACLISDQRGCAVAVRWCLDMGASVDPADKRGMTPLDLVPVGPHPRGDAAPRRSPATAAFLARGQTCTLLLDPARFFWIAALSSTELSRTETHRSTSHAAITMSPWRCCASNMAPKLTGFRLPARRPSRSRARMAMPT